MIKNSKLSIAKSCFRSKSFLWFASSLTKRQKNRVLFARISLLKKLQKLQQKNKNLSFFEELRNRKLLSLLYGGFSKRSLIGIKRKANQKSRLFSHSTTRNLITSLESRLDTCFFRMNFFSSFLQSRQQIKHGKVLVNFKTVRSYNFRVKPGDILSLNIAKKGSNSGGGRPQGSVNHKLGESIKLPQSPITGKHIKERAYKKRILNLKPQHLEINYKSLIGVMLFPPQQLYLPAPNQIKFGSYGAHHAHHKNSPKSTKTKGTFAKTMPQSRVLVLNQRSKKDSTQHSWVPPRVKKRSRILNSFFRNIKKKSFKFFSPDFAIRGL